MTDGTPMPAPAKLRAAAITFGYDADTVLLNNWSVCFEPGTMSAISGPSGRGKSTLLYLLGLMLRPQSGRVLIDDAVVSGLGDRSAAAIRAQSFGFVFQDSALDPTRSILDNVLEPTLYRGQRRSEHVAQALDLLDRFGVSVKPGRRPGEISGGQAQRVALCRAMLGSPPIMLGDEPTGNLDQDSARVVVEGLRSHAERGGTVVIVTHSADVVKACDREVRL